MPAMNRARVEEIVQLVRETFDLWDLRRVGFSWRHYYLNHTERIRNLSMNLGEQEGADSDRLEISAWLHDITKRYDGDIRKDEQGRRVLNEEGFWLNDMLQPDRANWVTELYEQLNLWGQVHHESGATLSRSILSELGFDRDEAEAVAEVVRGHLKPQNLTPDEFERRYRLPDTRVMYDADTIDPNLGYTALYRNIQIHMGRTLNGAEIDLRSYVSEAIPKWVAMKAEFTDHMISKAGRARAEDRYRRLQSLSRLLEQEAADFDLNAKYGVIGCVKFLMKDPEDPSLHRHASELERQWLPAQDQSLETEAISSRDAAREALTRARAFSDELNEEIRGEL